MQSPTQCAAHAVINCDSLQASLPSWNTAHGYRGICSPLSECMEGLDLLDKFHFCEA